MPFLANVTSAKMRSFVEPGQVLRVEAELEHDGSGFAATSARILRDGKKVCESNLMFRIMPFPSDMLKSNMLDRFAQISRTSAE
jgi:3-hydroxyacyl-[acyl-carrier-protein] dehydratase